MNRPTISVAAGAALCLLILVNPTGVHAHECIGPPGTNCLECHDVTLDFHLPHWTATPPIGLSPNCSICHCGDEATSPCRNVEGYGPVESVCCVSCHDSCQYVGVHALSTTTTLVATTSVSTTTSSVPADDAVVSIGNGSGLPGAASAPVAVSLSNPALRVGTLSLDICDADDFLTIAPDGCATTDRSSVMTCTASESVTGCASISISSQSGGFIDVGAGPIATLTYGIGIAAPAGECRDLSPAAVTVLDENGNPLQAAAEKGVFCFGSTTTSIDTTTTSTLESTTTTTAETTTTVLLSESFCIECHTECLGNTTTTTVSGMHDGLCRRCHSSAELHSNPGHTSCSQCHSGGIVKAGNVDAARCVICHPIGSPGTCNLVNLMDPAQEADCLSCHDDCLSVTTTTVLPECNLAIMPGLYSAYSGDSIAFRAESKGKNCIEGVYRWRIESGIGSQIGNDGMYTAGMNTTGGEATDTLTAEDTVNRIESLRYVTVRYEKITAVTPAALSRSYWIPIPHLLIIQGEGTHFSNQDTLVSFDPPSSVHLSWQVVLDDTTIWCFVVVMPAWYAGEKDQTVTATATTGREVLKKSFAISGLPFILDDDR